MLSSPASVLGLIFCVSEIGLGIRKRASSSQSALSDHGSLAVLWIVIGLCVLLAYGFPAEIPRANFGAAAPAARVIGVVLFVLGLSIRWFAIIYLGRFFTVNVAIAADHSLIDSGPYRLVRHPSYTGALLAFLGLGASLGNWVSVAVVTVPVFLVFLHRMRIEEAALSAGLGDAYRLYMLRTKRLIPMVY